MTQIYQLPINMETVSKIFYVLLDAKIIFFNRIFNMFIVAVFNRSIFEVINLFNKCGPRQFNLNFAKFFFHKDFNNTY